MTEEQIEELFEILRGVAESMSYWPTSLDGDLSRDGSETLVDAIDYLARESGAIASAITPRSAGAGRDASGGHVESLAEAVMGVTGGLCRIAEAIDNLAEAVREKD